MANSATPLVIDALIARAGTIAGLLVLDGMGATNDPGDYLMVGIEDPDIELASTSAETEEDFASVGAGMVSRDERGDITCAALSWNGDHGNAGQKAARDAVYAVLNAFADLIRADYTLGVDQVLWVSPRTSTRLMQVQDADGSSAALIFRIHFEARL